MSSGKRSYSMTLHAFKPHLSSSKPASIILNTCYGTYSMSKVPKYRSISRNARKCENPPKIRRVCNCWQCVLCGWISFKLEHIASLYGLHVWNYVFWASIHQVNSPNGLIFQTVFYIGPATNIANHIDEIIVLYLSDIVVKNMTYWLRRMMPYVNTSFAASHWKVIWDGKSMSQIFTTQMYADNVGSKALFDRRRSSTTASGAEQVVADGLNLRARVPRSNKLWNYSPSVQAGNIVAGHIWEIWWPRSGYEQGYKCLIFYSFLCRLVLECFLLLELLLVSTRSTRTVTVTKIMLCTQTLILL